MTAPQEPVYDYPKTNSGPLCRASGVGLPGQHGRLLPVLRRRGMPVSPAMPD